MGLRNLFEAVEKKSIIRPCKFVFGMCFLLGSKRDDRTKKQRIYKGNEKRISGNINGITISISFHEMA